MKTYLTPFCLFLTTHFGYAQQLSSGPIEELLDSVQVLIKARDFEKAYNLNQKMAASYGPQKDTFTVSITNQLGEIYERQRQYPDAHKAYFEALELQQELLGEEHEEITKILYGIARV